MPEYLTPGVYIEEFEIGAKPIEGVSTSTVGFLGRTERGPTIPPVFVDSFAKFSRIYGKYIEGSYLAYAVNGFFGNGGQRCYVGRIVHDGAEAASKTVDDLEFKAVGEGSWGNRVALRISDASDGDLKKFKLTLAYWSSNVPDSKFGEEYTDRKIMEILEDASHVEQFDDLSSEPSKPDHYLKKLGDPLNNLSNLVLLKGTGRPSNSSDIFELLENGSEPEDPPTRDDFLGDIAALPGEKRGLTAFNDIDEISIINVPDLYTIQDPQGVEKLFDDILAQCENLKDRFAILDAPHGQKNISNLDIVRVVGRESKYGALYYPWIKVYNPSTRDTIELPPGGHIAGIYARSDTERGVHKAPANEVVRGANNVEFNITKGEQALLNPRGINVIRSFPARGIRVWGARNIIRDPLWKYINVRRLFIYIEESIEKGTQWVVFEPNDEKLWARVRATVTQFLTGVWRGGALMGTKAEEAFFVKCDRTTMTQDDIDNGRLICVIGISPVKPAEFVIFRIAQWTGGSAVSE
jgi:phage tail sheath protein FI